MALVKEKRARGSVRVLDLMSYGLAIHLSQLLYRGGIEGCALALRDRRGKTVSKYDENHNIDFVEGDICRQKLGD